MASYRSLSAKLAIVNHDATTLDSEADLVIHGELCSVVEEVFNRVKFE